MGFIPVILFGLLPWLLMFGAAVYLIHLWKRPGPDELERSRLRELEEQVSLMRAFIRDAMERIQRLEDAQGMRPVPPGQEPEERGKLLPGEGTEETVPDPAPPASPGPAGPESDKT